MSTDEVIQLPPPRLDNDFPLMKALELRRSKRKWSGKKLSIEELSDLLWAACGINQEAKGKSKARRTSPSAHNSQAISLYLLSDDGYYFYDEYRHALIKKGEKDIREFLGTQKMMKEAPMGLVFVSDITRLGFLGKDERKMQFVSFGDTGFISQNIYLYCAAADINTVVLGLVNREALATALGLIDTQKVIYSQVFGR